MKNIILIDLDLTYIESIYKSKKVNIEFLITEADESKLAKIKETYIIKNIISRSQFHKATIQEDTKIDFDFIENFSISQLNSEHYQDRFSDDYSLKQYHYFNALSFWVDLFKKNNISAIILDGLMHGANYDTLPLDVAKYYNIPSFVIEDHMFRHTSDGVMSVRSVFDYISRKRISLDTKKLNLKSININNYFFYIDKNIIALKKKQKKLKDRIKSILPSYTPAILLLLGYLIRKKTMLHHGLNNRPFRAIMNIFYIKALKNYYNSISVKLDDSKKYIFYALHFDPEATIMSRARFSNQLSIIKQLSQSIPKGWTLYVKEHPDQYRLDQPGWWFYLTTIHKYRTRDFYKEILSLDNVELLKYESKSQDIIKSAKAISTINGSIGAEALSQNKTLMLFSHESSPFGLCKDVLKVTSTKDIRESLEKIEKGYTPNYSDFTHIINNYLFEFNDTSNDVTLLIDYLVNEYS